MTSERDPSRLVDDCVRLVREAVGARWVAAGIREEDGRSLFRLHESGLEGTMGMHPPEGLASLRGVLESVVAEKRPRRARRQTGEGSGDDPATAPGSFLAVPVPLDATGDGWICAIAPIGRAEFSEEDERTALLFAGWLAAAYDAAVVREGGRARETALRNEIAERRRAEEALQQRVQDLTRSNADLERFAYSASHDLQEPLRMVSSYTELLAKRYAGKLGPDADEFIHYAVDGSRRMGRMIQALLSYARAGAHQPRLMPVETGEVLESALFSIGPAIEEAEAVVTHDPLPMVETDESLLLQLFQNLICNAVKFRGDRPPLVHVAARLEAGEWVFSVKDNGIGIEHRFEEKIFQIFQRLHDRDVYPGCGIGLAICKRIVERLRGRIWLESAAGEGSTFYFSLPREP